MRFYENKYPEIDEYVVVKVQNIEEMGAYVSLLEYDNIEGMIQFTELTRRRVKAISKLIRVDKQEICVVLRVDKEKGNIDLSKRRANTEDIPVAEEKYQKAKTVHSIMRHLADITKQDMEQLCKDISWPLYKEYGHCFDAFKASLKEPDIIFKNIKFPNDDTKKALLNILKNRLKSQPVKIRADFEVTCFSSEGIDAIKSALKEGEKVSTKDFNIKIQLISPPLYVMITSTTNDQKIVISLMEQALSIIKEKINSSGGEIIVKAVPRVVSAKEEHNLNTLLESLKEEDEEVEDVEVIGM